MARSRWHGIISNLNEDRLKGRHEKSVGPEVTPNGNREAVWVLMRGDQENRWDADIKCYELYYQVRSMNYDVINTGTLYQDYFLV